MHLKTVELVFAEQSHACPRTVECCACRHVLVDMNTMHPMYGGKDCSPALYLEEVDAKISGLGGLSRLLACFHVFLRPSTDGQGVAVDLEASGVSLHFVQWKHRCKPLARRKCACSLCQSRFPAYVEPVALALLPVPFLTACEAELRRRAAAWERTYAWVATADLAARRASFAPDARPEAECVDFTEGSGVSCIKPSPTHADVYTTMPMLVRVRAGEIFGSEGTFYGHNLRCSRTHLHVHICMAEHEALDARGEGVQVLITASASSNHHLVLRDHLRALSNVYERSLTTDNFRRVVDAEIPALWACKGPRPWFPRMLGTASRKRKAPDSGDPNGEVPGLLPVLLGAARGAEVLAECRRDFPHEADAHAFAVLLGALAPVRELLDKLWFAVVEVVEEGTSARVRALHAAVSGGECCANLHRELASVAVPLLFLEMVHDAFRGGPLWCATSSPMQHAIIKDTGMVNGGNVLRDELVARGIEPGGLSLAQQRDAFERDVFAHIFCDSTALCPVVAHWRASGRGEDRCIRELVRTGITWLEFLREHGMCHATRYDVVDTVLALLGEA